MIAEPASTWDRFAAGYSRQVWLERDAMRLLIRLLQPLAGARLLDVGTGPGVLMAALAASDQPPREAVGIDSSREMLSRAAPLPSAWRLELADATELPFADESFDVVCASYLLHVLDPEPRAAAIHETVRVLKPGGKLGAITVAPPRSLAARLVTAPVRAAARSSKGRLRGLRPLDPAPELERAGLELAASGRSLRGYPSLVTVARRKPA